MSQNFLTLILGVAIRVRCRVRVVLTHAYPTIWVNTNLTYLLNESRFLNPNTTHLLNESVVSPIYQILSKWKKRLRKKKQINILDIKFKTNK